MRIIIVLVFFSTTALFSQVSEIVNETWYLRYLRINGVNNYVPNDETLILDINEVSGQYTAETNGIVNTFDGSLTFDTVNEILEFTNINVTLFDCLILNCDYENLYFYELLTDQFFTLKSFTYFYYEFSNGKKMLRLTDMFGNNATYSHQPLEEPNPALFRTWYLHSMDADFGETTYIVDYVPPMNPTLTIAEDLSFTGIGFCNEFSGDFIYTSGFLDPYLLLPMNFDETGTTCSHHNGFEDNYFYQFSSMDLLYYNVWENPSTGEAGFSFDLMPGFTFNFFNYPVLSVVDNQRFIVSIYPNPASQSLHFTFLLDIESISITSIDGKFLQSLNKGDITDNSIDVSFLPVGIYFLVFETQQSRTVKKFIKQ